MNPPAISLMKFGLACSGKTGNELPPVTDTWLFADKFRGAALAWHGRIEQDYPEAERHPRNLCGREKDDNGERRIEGHNHAFFWPTDEDNDGFIDHVSVYCPHGFLASEVDALRRLLRIRQRGGRPDLLVTPVFLGDADFGPWKRPAAVFVSASPYFCPVNLTHGQKSGGKVRSIAKEIFRSLRLTDVVQTEVEVANIHELVFADAVDDLPATWTRADLSDARYRTAWLKPPDESFVPGTLAGLQLDGGTRLLRALAFCRRRRRHVVESIGRMLRIEFSIPRQSRPFSLGSQCHFGLGLFVPIRDERRSIDAFSSSVLSVSSVVLCFFLIHAPSEDASWIGCAGLTNNSTPALNGAHENRDPFRDVRRPTDPPGRRLSVAQERAVAGDRIA